jgi:hypothetical protein
MYLLIDIAVPGTTNLEKTYREKINKYTELADEIRRIWNQKEVKIIQETELSQSVHIELQKQVILGTCHIVRKFVPVIRKQPSQDAWLRSMS